MILLQKTAAQPHIVKIQSLSMSFIQETANINLGQMLWYQNTEDNGKELRHDTLVGRSGVYVLYNLHVTDPPISYSIFIDTHGTHTLLETVHIITCVRALCLAQLYCSCCKCYPCLSTLRKMGLGQAEQNCAFCVHMISCLYCCCTLGLSPCCCTLVL